MALGVNDQFLIAEGLVGTLGLGLGEVIDGALCEDIEPAGVMEDGGFDPFGVGADFLL